MKRSVALLRTMSATFLAAAMLAPTASAGPEYYDWVQLRRLAQGTEIMLTVKGGQPVPARLLFADDAAVISWRSDAPKLPRDAEHALLAVGRNWPGVLAGTGASTTGKVLVSHEGVFDGDAKLADIGQVVQVTHQEDFTVFQKQVRNRGLRNALITVGAIGVAVLTVFINLMPST